MICLSADLHHMSLKTGNQAFVNRSEINIALEYLKMLEKRNIRSTFFITGRSFEEEFKEVEKITSHPLTEIGGHNYEAFEPALLHRIWNKLTGNYNGPYWYQYYDTKKTINIIYQKTGIKIKVWRNHMYMHGKNSEKILASLGINICSDGVKKDALGLLAHPDGIYNLPINIIPDHEHLIHAERTPQWIKIWQERYQWKDDFGKESYYIQEWSEMVLQQLKENEKNNRLSVMIIHPITMYLCDKFVCIKKILDYIQTKESIFMQDLLRESK